MATPDADPRTAAYAVVTVLEEDGAVPAPFGEHPILRLRVPMDWSRSRRWRFIAPIDRVDVWTEVHPRRGPLLSYRVSLLRQVTISLILLLLAVLMMPTMKSNLPWYAFPLAITVAMSATYLITLVRAPFYFRRAVARTRWPAEQASAS